MSRIFGLKISQGVLIIALLVCTLLPYSNSFFNSFVWVDESQIIRKGFIIDEPGELAKAFTTNLSSFKEVTKSGEYYRPFMYLSFTLDYLVWGENPFGFHLTSFILHLFCVYLVYALASLIFQKRFLAFFTALNFAVHPIHTSSVSWISGRADLLAGFFLLSSFCLYLKSISQAKGRYYILALFFFIFSLLSKEISVVLPLILFLYNLQFLGSIQIRKVLPFFLISFFYVYVRKIVLGDIGAGLPFLLGDPFSTILTSTHSAAAFIFQFVFPFKLTIADTFPIAQSIWEGKVFLSAALLISLLVIAAFYIKKKKEVSFAILWFFIFLIPLFNIVPAMHFRAERFMYLPSIGYCLLVSALFLRGFRSEKIRQALVIVAVAMVSFYLVRTLIRNFDFYDDITLFSKTIQTNPNCTEAYTVLGNTYLSQKKYKEAIELYRRALLPYPGYSNYRSPAEVNNNIGYAYEMTGEFEKAIEHYRSAIALKPNRELYKKNLAIVLAKLKKI